MSILTLSGWAQPAGALTFLIPGSEAFNYSNFKSADEVLLNLRNLNPRIAIGWSLGGLLLVNAIAQQVIQPKMLVLLSTPYQFVATSDYPTAMQRYTFDLFSRNYNENPSRTAGRFDALIAKGDIRHKEVLKELSGNNVAENSTLWAPWLDHLSEASCKTLDFGKFPATLIVHGRQDAIVNVAQTASFQNALPISTTRIAQWEGCGHAPHYHAPERLISLIREMGDVYV